MRNPDNTPIDEWLSVWLFHKVAELADGNLPAGHPKGYMALSSDEKVDRGLPTNRDQAITWLKQRGIK